MSAADSNTTQATQLSLLKDDEHALMVASIGFRERLLLILAGLFVVVIQSGLIAARDLGITEYWHTLIWIVCALLGHLVLRRRLPHRDPFLFPAVMLLAGWGLTLIDRLAPPFATRQTAWLAISVGALLAIVVLPGHLRWLRRYRYLWLITGLGLLILTVLLGTNPSGGGPRLWLGIPDVYFQPSELLKVILLVFLASYLADNRALLALDRRHIGPVSIPPLRFLAPILLMWGISVLVLVWQRDLGTATLFFVVFLAMLYLASGEISYVLEGGVLLVVAALEAYRQFDVVRLRVMVWWDPWSHAQNEAFQIVQSLLAFSAGGVFGQGVGQGSPTYIPVVHSDFVFAAVGEEWGLLGTLAVTAILALLVVRGMRIAERNRDRPFRAYLAAGISITLAAQSLLIIGGVLKMIPLT